jgi:mono/diheme cytochrome c family protein
VILPLCAALWLAQGQGELTALQRAKAEWYLRQRLPCLGCHELGGEGGRVGPNLSDVMQRRTPEYVSAIIRDPQATVPGTIMPRVPMPQATLQLITSYLAPGQAPGASRQVRTPPTAAPPEREDAAAVYGRFCTPCHGSEGRGNGDNARFLPVRPTDHSDSAYMSRRTDDALFDAIYAGGYVMNRSHRMPPYGETLTRDQIRDVVSYLRTLCHCNGPAWSRDNR